MQFSRAGLANGGGSSFALLSFGYQHQVFLNSLKKEKRDVVHKTWWILNYILGEAGRDTAGRCSEENPPE